MHSSRLRACFECHPFRTWPDRFVMASYDLCIVTALERSGSLFLPMCIVTATNDHAQFSFISMLHIRRCNRVISRCSQAT